MKFKRLIAFSLALSMLTLTAAACGKSAEESTEADNKIETTAPAADDKTEATEVSETEEAGVVFPLEETMTFTMMNNYFSEDAKLADNPVMKILTENANIAFEYTEVVRAESVEKANLLFNGDNYPDCFFKLPDLDWYNLGKEGFIIPLEDLIREYAPNITALLDERDGWDLIAEADGHIYTIPAIGRAYTATSSSYLWYNKTWMEKVGIKEEPSSMDELYELLKAFKENDVNGNGDPNDEIPLHLNMSHSWKNMQAYMTDGIHWRNTYMALMDEGEYADKMVFYPRTEEFKENLLKYLIQWYEEDLIDQNMFTQSYEQSTSIGKTSNIYGMFWNTLSYQASPDENKTEYHTLDPFEAGYWPMNNGLTKGAFAITDKCEHPEILIAWIDTLYSEEGSNLVQMGREGIDYVINEDGSYTAQEGQWRIAGGCATPGRSTDLSSNVDRGDATYQNEERYHIDDDFGVILPTITNTDEELTQLSDLQSNIVNYTENYVAQLMIGEISLDDTWEEFQNTLLEMGVEKMESIYQSGYDRANAK